jgi:hypothetical protein
MDSRAFISDGSLTSLSHAKPPSQKEIKNKLNSAERRENEIKWKEKISLSLHAASKFSALL